MVGKKRRSVMLLMVVAMVFSFALAGCGGAKPSTEGAKQENGAATDGAKGKDLKIGLATDMGSVNDKSFNQSAWAGLNKAKDEFGVEIKYLEPKSDKDIIPNLNQFLKGGYDLTWGTGFPLVDPIAQLSKDNPDKKMGIIDGEVKAPNVASVLFQEHEGSFLVGVIAGLTTKTNKIGFVGGMENPVIKRFEAGFRAGIKEVNPKAEFKSIYVGNFNRVDMGKSAAATLYGDGMDIIFHASGIVGNGVFNEAKERFGRGERVWVIGVDMDQSETFGHDITLTSMIKKVDVAVYEIAKLLVEDKFPGGKTTFMGLKENGVGIAPTSDKNVSADILKKVDEYREKIIKGEIKVPTE
ncbi:BMP family lipoprotein [Paenibacillus sp. 481]|uniref:BMP family lipoprotein n=1 Tax=Paenibacillus sp. 481 TaxID=2835869 RepID=UPI001E48918C|nr:BMP family protein [Paenibacillus sp. 481]UHA75286.1 BMP family protein [Paenibacillus sp. 481]